jgi:hypothetical protein
MDIGCGFMTFDEEALLQGFFIEISPLNATTGILLKSLPDITLCSGSCGNSGNVLFFHYRGFSSCSSESVSI